MTPKTRIARFTLGAAVAVMAASLAPGAMAAHGGNHGASAGDPTLTVSSTSVAAGDMFTSAGCGYAQGQPVNVTVSSPTALYFFPVGVDGNGCVAFGEVTSEPGLYTVKTYQSGNGGKQALLATATVNAT